MDTPKIEKAFSDAFIEFVAKTTAIPSIVDHPGIFAAAADMCRLLRAAFLEVVMCERDCNNPTIGNTMRETGSIVFFSADEYDKERVIRIDKRTAFGNTARYTVCQYPGQPDWTDEERSNIDKFISVMFLLNGRARAMEIANKLSYSDADMEVYNLRYFMDTLGMMMAQKQAEGFVAARINIKKLGALNARIGRQGGTAVLCRYIYGLRDMLGEDGFVSRLGGDNFLALFRAERLEEVKRYLTLIKLPLNFRGLEEVNISSHVGYCQIDQSCRTPADVMDKIIIAMNMARSNIKLPYIVYNEEIKRLSDHKKRVEAMFFDAIDNEEFLVYYQPKSDLRTYTMCGAEALCRWKHDGELIPPVRFIPILEQSNNICVLDFYMLEHVCRDMRRWLDSGMPAVRVSVNLSRVHLGDDGLAEQVTSIIDKYNIPHEYIEIELTETTTDVDFKELKTIVSALHRAGIATSVDDFGVGYSSLNLIRDLPWNVLKIDKSFLPDESDENKNNKKIMLRYVIAMAHDLGLECLVEGVETMQQVELLKELECYRAQGYFFDKPLPVEVFEQKMIEYSRFKNKEQE